MRKTTKIVITVILVAILLLGIGYAAIQNITLNILGTAAADPNQANFKVKFAEVTNVSDSNKVTAAITDDLNATINVTGLTSRRETATATYTVQNVSADLSANLSVKATNSNTEYFAIETKLAKPSIKAGEATTLIVTVELIKTPITATVDTTVGVQITASPVQPGEEGTGGNEGGSDGPTLTTLAEVTNLNIGDYIDLGNNIVGTESTADDWRILYADGERVYAILSDYLPNSTGYAENAGLATLGESYRITIDSDKSVQLDKLTNVSNWNGLANGISGATATGGPTLELIINSYNTKNNTGLVYPNCPAFDNETIDYDIYLPPLGKLTSSVDGYVCTTLTESGGSFRLIDYTFGVNESYRGSYGLRPVVSLPIDISVEQNGKNMDSGKIKLENTNKKT